MRPDDLIEKGMLRDTDLEGGPPVEGGETEPGSFGRYLLLQELGRGGAAIVYRARDPLLNREIALKRLRFGDPELEARFLREAGLLARLSHPGIIPIYDFGKEGDSLFYTMPLATGLSLDRWIAERRPNPREAARVVWQAAEALAHAHERGVLHRDVKPANILVRGDGIPMLADFGLGRMDEPSDSDLGRVTESGEVMGTPGYMAPELAMRDLRSADARCDVYSLGATLYEALTGRPPFLGTSALEILMRSATDEPVRPRKLASRVPEDLEIICLKALEKEPHRRFATAREMADDIGRCLAGEPIHARRASVFYRLGRFVSRRRGVVAMAAAGILVAAGLTAFFVFREESAASRRRRAEDHLGRASHHADGIHDDLRKVSEKDAKVQRQVRLAFEEIDRAIEIDPDNALAHYSRGRIHSLLGEKDAARACYEVAIRKGPVAKAHLERALIDCQELLELRFGGASRNEDRARELQASIRNDLDALTRLGAGPQELGFALALNELSRMNLKGDKKAVAMLKDYTDQYRDFRAYYWRGVAEAASGDFKAAQDSLETALEYRRNSRVSALILDLLGYSLLQLDNVKEAESHFRSANQLDPEMFGPMVNLATVLWHLKKLDESLAWCDKAIRLVPKSPLAHAIRGQCLALMHQGLGDEADSAEGKRMIQEARFSLRIALAAYRPDSAQAAALQDSWKYVNQGSDY